MNAFCFRCAEPGTVIDIAKDGEVVLTGALCERCFAEALAEMAEHRKEFEALLEAGLSREAANARMIEKLAGLGASA